MESNETNPWRERMTGFVGGLLILIAVTFIYSQYRFQVDQKFFYIGMIEGSWTDVPVPAKKK